MFLSDLKKKLIKNNHYLKDRFESEEYILRKKITAKRIILDLSHEDLANILETNVETIYKIEAGIKIDDESLCDRALKILNNL